jgi:uncharacterized membrane protein
LGERGRCYRLRIRRRPWFVCARCLGIGLAFVPLLALHAFGVVEWFFRWPALVLLGFPLPGVLDWSLGRLCGADSGNLVRTATGLLLGAAQAAAYCVAVVDPTSPLLWAAVGGWGGTVGVVALAGRIRERAARRDPVAHPDSRGGP